MDLESDGERFGKPGGPAAEVSLRLNGTAHTFQVAGWKGAPETPYTFDEMADKFRRYVGSRLTPGRVEDIIQNVRTLEDLADVGELGRLLRSG